jgi:hypothetical protein
MTETERKAKAAARARVWHWNNRDKALAKSRRYRQQHLAYFAAKRREYGVTHRIELNRQQRIRARLRRLLNPKPRKQRVRQSVEEVRARRRQYYRNNRDRINAKRRAVYKLKAASERERCKRYRERNRVALRARGRARYWREHDKFLFWSRRAYQRHGHKYRERQKRYRNDPLTRPLRLAQKRRYYARTHGRLSPEYSVRRRKRAARKRRTYWHAQIRTLSSRYVRHLLSKGTSLKATDFSPEIVRIQRAKLRLLRAARTSKKVKDKKQ